VKQGQGVLALVLSVGPVKDELDASVTVLRTAEAQLDVPGEPTASVI